MKRKKYMAYRKKHKPCAIFDDVFLGKTVPKTHEKVRNVCPMLVNVKKCMYFAHAHIKRNVLMDN